MARKITKNTSVKQIHTRTLPAEWYNQRKHFDFFWGNQQRGLPEEEKREGNMQHKTHLYKHKNAFKFEKVVELTAEKSSN